jgi:CheY-like chemotaxis protein
MDGDIWVESKSQKGSAFHFTIWVPFSAEQLSISESNESLLVNKRLLVAAKNDTNRRILTRYAQTWGMYSRHTPSGQEALTWLQQKEAFDVIIINNELTEMSGLSLAEQIRQTLPHLKSSLIYLNKFGQQFEADMMAEHGFAAVLTKPIKPSQFFNTLMTLFNESHETAPSLPSTRLAKPLEKTIPLRILLAEDNLVNQKVALKTLKHLGYQADVVGNGLAVLEALSHTQYDLILMDIQMPEMDGLTATRQLRATQPNKQCPWIIAMTANAMEGDRDKCLAAGMNDYLTKPIQMDQLIEALLVAASQRKKASADPY